MQTLPVCGDSAVCDAAVVPPKPADNDSGIDETDAPDPPPPPHCMSDADCDDGRFCTGRERCLTDAPLSETAIINGYAGCQQAREPACGANVCDETSMRCDCHADLDFAKAWFCGGTDADADGDGANGVNCVANCKDCVDRCDCDDHDPGRFPGNAEVCDDEARDEDCDPTTFGARDRDHDGALDNSCYNRDPNTGESWRPDPSVADCDDLMDETHPLAREDCDYHDNDCDGYVDEQPEGPGPHENKAQQLWYCRDLDGDGYSMDATPIQRCGQPSGYIRCRDDGKQDCDESIETGPLSYPGNLELCDGIDNNCDQQKDNPRSGQHLLGQPTFSDGTDAQCVGGAWQLQCPADKAWCEKDTYKFGCETDVTRLSSCRSCDETQCHFSCGQRGCDEVARIAVGRDFACAMTGEGTAACWGHGIDGHLGDGSLQNSAVARKVLNLEHVSDLSVGTEHACAIADPGRAVYCWGNNAFGRLGSHDVRESASEPWLVAGLTSDNALGLTGARSVAVGDQHSCVILDPSPPRGNVACWGQNKDGRLGDQIVEEAPRPPSLATRMMVSPIGLLRSSIANAVAVSVGEEHTCILSDANTLECWGANSHGQLGAPLDILSADAARTVTGLPDGAIEQVAAGALHTCALVAGRVYCWGSNERQQLGRDTNGSDPIPKEVPNVPPIVEIAAGRDFSCARTEAGDVYCWGANSGGQLGLTDVKATAPPAIIVQGARQISVGGFACVLDESNELSCWGSNYYGQRGDGTTSIEPQPIAKPIEPLQGSRR